MIGGAVTWAIIIFVVAAAIFAIGLVLIGVPGWLVLHRLSLRGPWSAGLWGAIATFLATVLFDLSQNRALVFEMGDCMLALDGALVGFVIQRLAYRPKPRPAPPSAAPTP